MNFIDALRHRWVQANSLLCVGLDPEPAKFPAHLQNDPDAIFTFCRTIIDATASLACCFKPQIAHFAALSAETTLQRLITYIHETHAGIPVILDAKRGDIGSTAQHYATEAFDRYDADAVTVNPYLGRDSVQPFLDRRDKGVVLLCRTSNPGAQDFQDLDCNGQPLYQRVAETITRDWNTNGNCMLVVGATWPHELAQIRSIVGHMPLLVPGVGAQGGDIEQVVSQGKTIDDHKNNYGSGLVISASRAILYASHAEDFASAAATAAQALRDQINAYR